MKNIFIFFSFTLIFIFASTTIAQNSNDSLVNSKKFVKEDPRDKVKYNLSLEQNGCEAYIIANIEIIDGWHINGANLPIDCYSLPTEIILAQDTLLFIDSDSIIEPEYEEIYDKVAKEMLYLHDSAITMKKKITLLSDSNFVLKGTFTFQTCDDVHCLPPFSDKFTFKISGCSQKSSANEKNSNEVMIIIFGLISLLIISVLILRRRKA